jgi:restriction endonuclease S subunit
MRDFRPESLAELIRNPESLVLLESFLYDVAIESAAPKSNLVSISDLGQTFTGTSASESTRKSLEKVSSSIPYISTKDVGYEPNSINYDSGLRVPDSTSDFKIAPSGSVLICLEGGSAGKKMAITDRPIAFGNKLLALVPKEGILSEYVFALYKSTSFKVQFQDSMHGVFGGISKKKFLNIQVHELTEKQQRQMLDRLAEFLGESKAIESLLFKRTSLANQVSKTFLRLAQTQVKPIELHDLAKSISAFSNSRDALLDFQKTATSLAINGAINLPGIDESRWKRGPLGDFLEMSYGKAMPAKARDSKGPIPVYGSNGVVGFHSEALIETPAIVIGRKGSSGAINQTSGPSWITDVAYYVVPPKDLDLVFARIFLESLGLEQLGRGVKPGLARNEAYAIQVAIPTVAEQKILVDFILEVESSVSTAITHLEGKERIQVKGTRAIINSAFTGLLAIR